MPDDDQQTNVSSLADRAAAGEAAEPEPELFPIGSVDGDQGVTIKTLIKSGQEVQFTMSMRSAEVPVRGQGMLHPDREAALLVRVEPGKAELVPVREGEAGEKRITGWKVRQQLRPVHILRVEAKGADIEAGFRELCSGDARQAAQVLDRMQAALAEVLKAA